MLTIRVIIYLCFLALPPTLVGGVTGRSVLVNIVVGNTTSNDINAGLVSWCHRRVAKSGPVVSPSGVVVSELSVGFNVGFSTLKSPLHRVSPNQRRLSQKCRGWVHEAKTASSRNWQRVITKHASYSESRKQSQWRPVWQRTILLNVRRVSKIDLIGTWDFSRDTGSYYVLRRSLPCVVDYYPGTDDLVDFRQKHRCLEFYSKPRSLAYAHFGQLGMINASLYPTYDCEYQRQEDYRPVSRQVWFDGPPKPKPYCWHGWLYFAGFCACICCACLCVWLWFGFWDAESIAGLLCCASAALGFVGLAVMFGHLLFGPSACVMVSAPPLLDSRPVVMLLSQLSPSRPVQTSALSGVAA